ncbi:MAG TPA: hypothetical protein EYP22_00505 [Methanosarcinales archaeon]|nr:hypothetical protein [Methanosarcinales archaeon]
MTTAIDVYESLKLKLGEKETRELIEYIEKSTDIDTLKKEIISELMKVMATKEELFATTDELKKEINKIWNELYKLREEITKQGADLRNEKGVFDHAYRRCLHPCCEPRFCPSR